MLRKPFDRHGCVHLPGMGQTPRPFSRHGKSASLYHGHSQAPEKPGHGTAAFALLEAIAAQLSPSPYIQALQLKPTGRVAVVVDPPHQEQIEFDNHLGPANTPMATGDLPDFLLRAFDALGSDPQFTVQQQPMAEEFAFPNRSDGALFAVNAQPELLFQKPHHLFHHSLPCRQRLHVDVAVVGVAAETMAPAFQFLVQIVQQKI